MKVDVVGNGCSWTKELSTSFIINDEILFDAPEGSFKTLMNEYDLTKINYIIISHFHSDHFLNLYIVFDYLVKVCPEKKITILAPAGCRERLCSLFRVLEVPYLEEMLNGRVTFIDAENGKSFKFNQYKIKAFKMAHKNLDAYGFLIEKDGIKIGFTGDTSMCNNVHKILKKASHCFIDTANINIDCKHLSVGEVVNLQNEYPNCKLHFVHLSTYSKAELERLGIDYTKEGQTIEIN